MHLNFRPVHRRVRPPIGAQGPPHSAVRKAFGAFQNLDAGRGNGWMLKGTKVRRRITTKVGIGTAVTSDEAVEYRPGVPANARQIMYAARPAILQLTGLEALDGGYFIQTLLVDYVEQHPGESRDWRVVFDARGSFTEPHTNHEVPLGTLEVERYVDCITSRPNDGDDERAMAPLAVRHATLGPRNRYRNVLFVEKQGFDELLHDARIAERFDIAVMLTKGTSVTAARKLLDDLAPDLGQILVLHDFDIAGFSILGTLGTDGRRYTFANRVNVVDLGLRLADVRSMRLESEPVADDGKWVARATTLARHRATTEEIGFLRTRRVELNAMSSRQFVDFIQAKLIEHGIRKVIPARATLELHARHVMASVERRQVVAEAEGRITRAAERPVPKELSALVRKQFKADPTLPWDAAVAHVLAAGGSQHGR